MPCFEGVTPLKRAIRGCAGFSFGIYFVQLGHIPYSSHISFSLQGKLKVPFGHLNRMPWVRFFRAQAAQCAP